MELGKAKYGSGKNVLKIQDGDNVFRILPPMGKLAKTGKWNQYYRIEWGFKNSAGRNRPFQDVRVVNFQSKMVEVESAAHLQREALAEKKKELMASLRKDPSNPVLKQQYVDVTEDTKRYNLDAKYYVNAMDLSGKIGLLKIGSRAFKALKAEIDALRKQGVDPLSIENGRFFNFKRTNDTGNFQDTQYQVTVYKETVNVNGETYEKAKVSVIDQSIIDRLSDEAYELSGMYPVVSASQVERMVKEGSTAVDLILGSGNESGSQDADAGDEDTAPAVSAPVQAKPAPVAAPVVSQAPVAKPQAVAPVEVKKETPAPVAAAPVKTGNDLSDDEFLKSIGAM